jgi:transposase
VVEATGKIVREAKVASEPAALIAFIANLGLSVAAVGLEAGPLSAWLYDGLKAAGYAVVLLETRQVKAALSAMTVKTDRRDARGSRRFAETAAARRCRATPRGIAQLLRLGWYRPVHRTSATAQEVRALLAAHKQLQSKLIDLEQTARGLLRGFGLKMGETTRGRFEDRVLELVAGQAMLERIMRPLLRARAALRRELAMLHKQTLAMAREDAVCRRLMTVPGVGAVVALTDRAGVDDPGRFPRSKMLGA